MITTTIHRPELTAAERAKRMEEIKQAAARLVLETEKAKQGKGQKKKYIKGEQAK